MHKLDFLSVPLGSLAAALEGSQFLGPTWSKPVALLLGAVAFVLARNTPTKKPE